MSCPTRFIAKGDLRALYNLACDLYDPVYPQDVDAPGHSFENLTDSVNPLRRFIQYQILNKYVAGTADLTPMEVNIGVVNGALALKRLLSTLLTGTTPCCLTP